jgi:hypothetical protein
MDGDEAAERLQDVNGSTEPAGVRGDKTARPRRPWRHPLNRAIEVPYQVAAAVAVMEMGISEYGVIAEAVGLTVAEVRGIDTAEDSSVRELAVAGIPIGEFFKLARRVRCPKCQAKVEIAPCVTCHSMLRRGGDGPCEPSQPRVA